MPSCKRNGSQFKKKGVVRLAVCIRGFYIWVDGGLIVAQMWPVDTSLKSLSLSLMSYDPGTLLAQDTWSLLLKALSTNQLCSLCSLSSVFCKAVVRFSHLVKCWFIFFKAKPHHKCHCVLPLGSMTCPAGSLSGDFSQLLPSDGQVIKSKWLPSVAITPLRLLHGTLLQRESPSR